MESMVSKTMNDVVSLYSKVDTPKDMSNLRSVLRKYVLPFLPRHRFSSKELEGKGIYNCLSKIRIQDFRQADIESILAEQLYEAMAAGKVKKHTAEGYVSSLRKFLRWMRSQDWYIEAARTWDGRYAPLIRLTPDSELHANKAIREKSINRSSYRLRDSELTDKLKRQLAEFERFWTEDPSEARPGRPLRLVTLTRRKEHILYFLGWLKNIHWLTEQEDEETGYKFCEYHHPGELDLALLENLKLLKKMVNWGIRDRGNSYAWAIFQVGAALNVAKWRHALEIESGDFRDIDAVKKIMQYRKQIQENYTPNLDVDSKEMSHEQCVEVVSYLKRCTLPKTRNWVKRSPRAVMLARQKYLIIGILTYCPLRSRELRELTVGKTLVRTQEGLFLNLKPEDHKMGYKTKQGRKINLSEWLPAELVSDLEEWIEVHRLQIWEIIKDLDSWLEFWGHSRSELETLPAKIQTKQDTGDNKNLDTLERELRGLRGLVDTWNEVKAYKKHDHVFFALGCPHTPQTFLRPFYDPDSEKCGKLHVQFSTMVKRVVRTTTAVLVETEHPLFIDVSPRETNPHFFRHIGTTAVEKGESDYRQVKAFHEGIGNSEKTAKNYYNLLSPEERTAAAARWWAKAKSESKQLQVIDLVKVLLKELTPEERQELLEG